MSTAPLVAMSAALLYVRSELTMLCDEHGCPCAAVQRGSEAYSAAMFRMPRELIEAGLLELVGDGWVIERALGYEIVDYKIAQEVTVTPAQRARVSRERAREAAEFVTICDGDVTWRDETGRVEITTTRDGLQQERDASERELKPPAENVTRRDTSATKRDASVRRAAPSEISSSSDLRSENQNEEEDQTRETPTQQDVTPRDVRDRLRETRTAAWNYSIARQKALVASGIPGTGHAIGLMMGSGEVALNAIIRELQSNGLGFDEVLAKCKHRIEIAECEARRDHDAQWFQPTRLWNADQFWRAVEMTAAQASQPKAARSTGNMRPVVVDPPRAFSHFGEVPK